MSSQHSPLHSLSMQMQMQPNKSIPLDRFDSLSGLSAVVDALAHHNSDHDEVGGGGVSNMNSNMNNIDVQSLGGTSSVFSLGSIGARASITPQLDGGGGGGSSLKNINNNTTNNINIMEDDTISLGSFSLGSNVNMNINLADPSSSNTGGIKEQLTPGVGVGVGVGTVGGGTGDTSDTCNNVNVNNKMKQISQRMSILPPAVQEMLADRIVETILMPDAWKQQVDAVAALAAVISDVSTCGVGVGPGVGEQQQQLLSITDGSINTACTSNEHRKSDMMPNHLSLAIATLGIFLTKYASNGGGGSSMNPDVVNGNVTKVAAMAAEEARKRLPISLTAQGMTSSSLPILIATLVTFLSKYTAHSATAAAAAGEDNGAASAVSPGVPAVSSGGGGSSNVILHLTERAHADKKIPPKL